MSLAINWVLKIHFQHRWTRHTICSLRITNTGKEYKRDVKICTRDFTFVATEQSWLTPFYKSHGNHCNTSCLQSKLTPQRSVRIFFCNASSNSSATILPQSWISLGSARMRNTDSHIFHKDGPLPAWLEWYAFRIGSKRSRRRFVSAFSIKAKKCFTANPQIESFIGPVQSTSNKSNTADGSSDDEPRFGDLVGTRGGCIRGFSSRSIRIPSEINRDPLKSSLKEFTLPVYVEASNSIVVLSYASPAMKPAINISMFGVFASFFFYRRSSQLAGRDAISNKSCKVWYSLCSGHARRTQAVKFSFRGLTAPSYHRSPWTWCD